MADGQAAAALAGGSKHVMRAGWMTPRFSASRTLKCCCAVFILLPRLGSCQGQSSDLSSAGLRASVTAPAKPQLSIITPELRGDIYMARKMYREAVDAYRQGTPTALLFNKIGIAFQQMLYPDLAKKNYEQAVALKHCYAEALNNLGTIYFERLDYRKAIRYYKRSLKCSASAAVSYANLGAAYFARHDYKKAFASYAEALKLDPTVLDAGSGVGTRVLQRNVAELALFHLYLAKIYAMRGANEQALTCLRKSLEEGLKDRKKLAEIPEFASLRKQPAFQELLAENPRPL
jgi:tetratricopeptide (TPR) repeat protein